MPPLPFRYHFTLLDRVGQRFDGGTHETHKKAWQAKEVYKMMVFTALLGLVATGRALSPPTRLARALLGDPTKAPLRNAVRETLRTIDRPGEKDQ